MQWREIIDTTRDIESFIAAPEGRRYISKTFMAFRGNGGGLRGYALWGKTALDEANQLVRVLEHAVYATLSNESVEVFADYGRVEAFAPTAFEHVARCVRSVGQPKFGKQAVVIPPGFAGMAIVGFASSLPRTPTCQVFEDRDEAIRWLGNTEAAAIAATMDKTAKALPLVTLRQRLTAFLMENPASSLEQAAHALGRSKRTLQRELAEQHIEFREVRSQARFKVAVELLRSTDVKLEVVARHIGFSSSSHFFAFFQTHAGRSPNEVRKRGAKKAR